MTPDMMEQATYVFRNGRTVTVGPFGAGLCPGSGIAEGLDTINDEPDWPFVGDECSIQRDIPEAARALVSRPVRKFVSVLG